MRKLLALVFLSMTCGGSNADPHQIVDCMGWTVNGGMAFTGQCELACQMPPPSNGTTCDTAKAPGCNSFDFDGTSGCCFPEQASGPIRFYPCF